MPSFKRHKKFHKLSPFKIRPEFKTRHDDGRVFPTGRYFVYMPAISREEFPAITKKLLSNSQLTLKEPLEGTWQTHLLLRNESLASQIQQVNPNEIYAIDNSTIALTYPTYNLEGGKLQKRNTISVDLPSINPDIMDKLSKMGFNVKEVHIHSIPFTDSKEGALLVKHHHFEIPAEPMQLKKLVDLLKSEPLEVSKIKIKRNI